MIDFTTAKQIVEKRWLLPQPWRPNQMKVYDDECTHDDCIWVIVCNDANLTGASEEQIKNGWETYLVERMYGLNTPAGTGSLKIAIRDLLERRDVHTARLKQQERP